MKYMTKEWYDLCQKAGSPPFDEDLNKQVELTIHAYWNEYEKTFNTPPKFMETIDNLHDAEVLSAKHLNNDYVITINGNVWGARGTLQIVLKNAIIKKQDFENQKIGWGYDELYKTDIGYELHVLFFEYGTSKMYDLIVECENINIIDNQTGTAK